MFHRFQGVANKEPSTTSGSMHGSLAAFFQLVRHIHTQPVTSHWVVTTMRSKDPLSAPPLRYVAVGSEITGSSR